jgi:hypothetical protein
LHDWIDASLSFEFVFEGALNKVSFGGDQRVLGRHVFVDPVCRLLRGLELRDCSEQLLAPRPSFIGAVHEAISAIAAVLRAVLAMSQPRKKSNDEVHPLRTVLPVGSGLSGRHRPGTGAPFRQMAECKQTAWRQAGSATPQATPWMPPFDASTWACGGRPFAVLPQKVGGVNEAHVAVDQHRVALVSLRLFERGHAGLWQIGRRLADLDLGGHEGFGASRASRVSSAN